MEVKMITTDNLHKGILDFINENKIIIGEYDDMKDCILKMIRSYRCMYISRNMSCSYNRRSS